MKKQDRNRLSKKDRRLIKKAMLKAAAKGSDEVYKIAPGLKDGFELLGSSPIKYSSSVFGSDSSGF